MLAHPLLNVDRLLFVKRYTYRSSHIYTDFFDGSSQMGGNLCILSPVAPDGKVTELVPQLDGGLFGRFDLSFDATKVVFAYKQPGKGYRIYEVGVDGSGLRQITHDGPDEAEMVRQFHHGYDDLDPCYLPDGRIMFVSTRSKRAVLCHNAFTRRPLLVMDADGTNFQCVSGNTTSEFTPSVMSDGRVLYTRWEYVDKGCGDVQSLWSMRPDGSGAAHVYKNNVALPSTLIDARSIPGSHRLIAVGAPHMPLAVGPLVLVDIHITQLTPAAMTNLTPEIGYPPHGGYPGAKFGFYKEPYPLAKICSWCPTIRARSTAIRPATASMCSTPPGGRELLYQDPDVSPLPADPLAAAAGAAAISSALPRKPAGRGLGHAVHGRRATKDDGHCPGQVKYVRVMEDVPKPWEPRGLAPPGDSCGLQNPVTSLNGHFTIKKIHGVVRVEEDGSAYFRVPAEKNLYFQALDENYMELQRMRTFVNLMPGEQRSCIGCHESRKSHAGPEAHRSDGPGPADPGTSCPSRATAARAWSTIRRTCSRSRQALPRCHSGTNPKGRVDLSGELTLLFNRSYETLIKGRLINNINVDPRSAYIPAEPPLTFGSHRSKMIEQIQSPPCKTNMSKEEFIRLVTWIDANAPYYGIYEGKRNVKWKDDPDFRPCPKP